MEIDPFFFFFSSSIEHQFHSPSSEEWWTIRLKQLKPIRCSSTTLFQQFEYQPPPPPYDRDSGVIVRFIYGSLTWPTSQRLVNRFTTAAIIDSRILPEFRPPLSSHHSFLPQMWFACRRGAVSERFHCPREVGRFTARRFSTRGRRGTNWIAQDEFKQIARICCLTIIPLRHCWDFVKRINNARRIFFCLFRQTIF